MRFEDVPWERWVPTVRATLMWVVRDGEVLLIRKKRGLGAGKINAPGGRIDPGETPLACAHREIEEEVGVRACEATYAGRLSFQFTDGLALGVEVFRAGGCEGELRETDEATPFWVPVDHIPYSEMWADDALWVPLLLAGVPFEGRMLFDGDTMLGWALDRR